jgi:glycosyltransferase involved in cell wall biosynthesis
MKTKVLLVIRWPVGGIRTFVRYVYRNFDRNKWQFTIIAPEMDEMKILIDDLHEFDVAYLPVREMPNDWTSCFGKMFQSVSRQLVIKKYDLIHSHGFTSGMCSAIPAFLLRTPHLMTSHETLNDKQFDDLKGKTRLIGMKFLFMLIDKVHSVSYDAQDNLLKYFPHLMRKGKCIVIPNGIEIRRFLEAERRDFRTELYLSDEVFLIGFLGRFMAPKGFRYLVDAIDILREVTDLPKKPLVLNFGEGGFIREEKQAIKVRGLEEFFRFMPFTPNVAKTLKGLDVVVMPSLSEACGLLAMEAMVCGTPLIGTDCIGLREILRNTPAIMVPKANSIALAQALRQEILANHKNEFMLFKQSAVDRFCASKTSRALLQFYGKMLQI